MDMNRRDDLRAVAVSVAVAFAFSFSTVAAFATDRDRDLQPAPITPSATSESTAHDHDATSVAVTALPAEGLSSGVGDSAVASTPPKSPSLPASPPVISAFFDADGTALTMVQFPAEHAGLLFGKELPPDSDAFRSVLAKNGVTFTVIQFPLTALKASMDSAGIDMKAVYYALAAGVVPPPSPDCLLEQASWSRCYKGRIDFDAWYQASYPSQDLDISATPPKWWKWRSLSPHLHTGYGP